MTEEAFYSPTQWLPANPHNHQEGGGAAWLGYCPPGEIDWNEQISFSEAALDDYAALEALWVATPPGQRLEACAALAAQLGVTVVSMFRRR